jgi:hypothetical protein
METGTRKTSQERLAIAIEYVTEATRLAEQADEELWSAIVPGITEPLCRLRDLVSELPKIRDGLKALVDKSQAEN